MFTEDGGFIYILEYKLSNGKSFWSKIQEIFISKVIWLKFHILGKFFWTYMWYQNPKTLFIIMAEIGDIIFVFIIIIVTVKVDVSRNLEPELHHQENAWLVSIANTKNTIIAFGFIFLKEKI